ncbi:MAG: aminodeoxychorismate/anthranilate synthase component II [Chlamydiota bacterium]
MILLIDNYDSFTYNLYQLVAKTHPNIRVVRNDAISLEEIALMKPEAILLSPGPGRPEDAGICIPLIQRFAPEIPILGICLGHQAIGAAFGAEVIKAPEIFHGKKGTIFHSRKGLFKGVPLPFTAGRYHSLVVKKETLPPVLAISAETPEGMIMAIQHTIYPCYGIQFHPESILTSHGELLISNFLMSVPCCA